MDTKLTLKLDYGAIRKAKDYARQNHASLSDLVERFFNSITQKTEKKEQKMPPIVRSLAGALKGAGTIDAKSEYADYLEKKYK